MATVRRAVRVLAVATLAVLAGCGGSGAVDAGAPADTRGQVDAATGQTLVPTSTTFAPVGAPLTTLGRRSTTLPKVTVVDLQGGPDVDLSTFLPAEQPLLVWFWAPH